MLIDKAIKYYYFNYPRVSIEYINSKKFLRKHQEQELDYYFYSIKTRKNIFKKR